MVFDPPAARRAAVAMTFAHLAALTLAACGGDSPTGPTRRPVASVDVAPLQGDVWAGTVRQLQATPRASDGAALVGRQITWSSTDNEVVEVDAAGRLTAHAAGVATIVATSEGKVGHVTITVTETDLLYEGYRSGLPEMYVLSLKGGEPARVLPPHTVLVDPEPSPDGTKIAFVIADYESSTGDIYVVNRDGTGLTQLTFDPELDDQPTWSPDGQRIAFRRSSQGTGSDIMIIDATGGEPVRLGGPGHETGPSWSPDGRFIAFALVADVGGNPQIYTMKPDGTERTLRTADYTWAGGRNPSWLRRLSRIPSAPS